jgi:hypothetical protein
MHPLDSTNNFPQGGALEQLITQYGLIDTWANTPTCRIFTHYTQTVAARLDQIYMMRNLATSKISSTTVATLFYSPLGNNTSEILAHPCVETWQERMET